MLWLDKIVVQIHGQKKITIVSTTYWHFISFFFYKKTSKSIPQSRVWYTQRARNGKIVKFNSRYSRYLIIPVLSRVFCLLYWKKNSWNSIGGKKKIVKMNYSCTSQVLLSSIPILEKNAWNSINSSSMSQFEDPFHIKS